MVAMATKDIWFLCDLMLRLLFGLNKSVADMNVNLRYQFQSQDIREMLQTANMNVSMVTINCGYVRHFSKNIYKQ